MKPNIKIDSLGATSLGLPIFAYDFFFDKNVKNILILGGVHGDEIEGVIACKSLMAFFLKNSFFEQEKNKINILFIPEVNPEGILLKTRGNSQGIDLNRNLPTKDWSSAFENPRYNPGNAPCSTEENKILVNVLQERKWDYLISFHSWIPMLNINGNCSPLVEIIAEQIQYPIEKTVGYPTPGSLGTYAGLERDIPTLTYEIEREIRLDKISQVHVPAVAKAINFFSQNTK